MQIACFRKSFCCHATRTSTFVDKKRYIRRVKWVPFLNILIRTVTRHEGLTKIVLCMLLNIMVMVIDKTYNIQHTFMQYYIDSVITGCANGAIAVTSIIVNTIIMVFKKLYSQLRRIKILSKSSLIVRFDSSKNSLLCISQLIKEQK